MNAPPPDLQRRVEALLNKRSVVWRPALGGYTNAQRWVVALSDGSSCFVKAGADTYTADQLRAEHRVYSQLEAPFLPRFLAWQDDGDDAPILVLEDLSAAFWPPPWTPARVEAVRDMLNHVHASYVAGLPETWRDEGWQLVAQDPSAFLNLGIASEDWLARSLGILLAADAAAPFDATEMLHVDVRSDNICFAGDRVLLIDWNFACYGNGDLDLACWLPSLESEGGPPPESILPHASEFAAFVSGYFAARAGLVKIAHAPGVRNIQLAQLETALPWAVRALGLPPLDGPKAPQL